MKMSAATFPALEFEPKKLKLPTKNNFDSLLAAPPPYQQNYPAYSNVSANFNHSNTPSIFSQDNVRRRTSWSDLADGDDEAIKNSSGSSTISSFISVGGTTQNVIPFKREEAPTGCTPSMGSASADGNAVSAIHINKNNTNKHCNSHSQYFPSSEDNNALYQLHHNAYSIPVKRSGLTGSDSRRMSGSSSGIVPDFFTMYKGSPTQEKFTETGVHFPPMPAGRIVSPPGGGSSACSTTIGGPAQAQGFGYAVPPYRKRVEDVLGPDAPVASRTTSGGGSAGPVLITRGAPSNAPSGGRVKRNRMEELRQFCRKTPGRLTMLALFLLFIIAVIIGFVVYQILYFPTHLKFSWLAPELMRAGQPTPNMLQMDVAGQQIRFELAGNMPFKSNFVSVLDFKTNKVAIVDSSLRAGSRNLVCFVMDLDRTGIPDMATLQRAASKSASRTTQHLGWQETWNFLPVPLSTSGGSSTNLFQPDVVECRGARWIELRIVNTNQKPMKCSECYDFCLPEYGIEKDYIRDESFLNIVRRDCFYLFVPEWRSFAQAYSNQQNQLDFENYYRHGNHYQQNTHNGRNSNQPGSGSGSNLGSRVVGLVNEAGNQLGNTLVVDLKPTVQQAGQDLGNALAGVRPSLQNVGDQLESKWIELGNVPGKIANVSSTAWNTLQGGANFVRQKVFNGNDNNNNNNKNNNNRYGNGNNPFPDGGFDFAESQYSHNGNPQQASGNYGNYQPNGGFGINNYGSAERVNYPGNTKFTGNPGIPRIGEISSLNFLNYGQQQRQQSLQEILQQQQQDRNQHQNVNQDPTQNIPYQQHMSMGNGESIGSGIYGNGPTYGGIPPIVQQQNHQFPNDNNNLNRDNIPPINSQNPQKLSQMFTASSLDDQQRIQELQKNNNAYGLDLSKQRVHSGGINTNSNAFDSDLSRN